MGDALLRSATHKPLRERAKDYMAALMEARDAAINGRRLKLVQPAGLLFYVDWIPAHEFLVGLCTCISCSRIV